MIIIVSYLKPYNCLKKNSQNDGEFENIQII